jgi:hypothetical protein
MGGQRSNPANYAETAVTTKPTGEELAQKVVDMVDESIGYDGIEDGDPLKDAYETAKAILAD